MKYVPKIFETGAERFQPDPKYKYTDDQQYMLDQRFLAYLVGVVALGLPFVMLLATKTDTCFHSSISQFYYSQFFGDVLVAALVFIGTFLVAYRGECQNESKLATFAGLCAFGIALFPATASGCKEADYSGRILADFQTSPQLEDGLVPKEAVLVPKDEFFELFEGAGVLHFGSAALLFLFLAYYTFFVFTRVIKEEHVDEDGNLTPVKKARNRFYIGSGVVIVICMLAMLANGLNFFFTQTEWKWWEDTKATFWFEAFALWAFGLSWMVKGRFFGKLFLDPRDQLKQ